MSSGLTVRSGAPLSIERFEYTWGRQFTKKTRQKQVTVARTPSTQYPPALMSRIQNMVSVSPRFYAHERIHTVREMLAFTDHIKYKF